VRITEERMSTTHPPGRTRSPEPSGSAAMTASSTASQASARLSLIKAGGGGEKLAEVRVGKVALPGGIIDKAAT
jgi:hypothetical protein